MSLLNWLRPRSSKNTHRPRARLGVQQLEDRTVPASLGQIGGAGTELLQAKVMDAAGNVYLAGIFDQAADFDPGVGTTPHMVPQGTGSDEFVAKYTPGGDLVWAKRFGGSLGDAQMNGIAVDALGNIYLSGGLNGTADFGNGISLSATGSNGNAYVMKLDPSGATAWVRAVDVTLSSGAIGVAVDGGSVYSTGQFQGQVDFDRSRSYADNHDILNSALGKGKTPSVDVFVWRLTTDGAFVSAWRIGGTNYDHGESILAVNGSVIVEGAFRGTADFDPSPTATANRTTNAQDMFVARYTPDAVGGLTLNWVQTIGWGTTYMNYSRKIAADANYLYLPGGFAGTIDFDRNNGVSNAGDTLTSVAGSADVFVAKYNLTNGSLAWVRGFGGPGNEDGGGGSLVVDNGMVYSGGNFTQTVDFDPGHAYADNRDVLTSKGLTDGFNLQLDTNGAYVNAWRMGGAGYDSYGPVGVYGGRLYSAGRFEQTADFPTGGTLTSFGASDLFLMSLDIAPQIGSFTASSYSVPAGSPVTLTAANVTAPNAGSTITQVAFYRDSNGDGKLDSADDLLGYGTQTSSGTWAFTISTTGWASRTYRLFAQAKDSYGVFSDPLGLDLIVL